ncbi:poly [ADP-ribose] polymerase 1 isoform X1 [Nicotiana tomentosiformis]|uniref:poly [ADP-ribose] polymerase 1 isoform X1 n=1 Tax=Nicotiana tomentosiformis TaxID=4098 RepID=UPI00051B7F9A|nr:poly [ADP-ribose] polymerase 1 isoform X2 [Nicotiana tomentosiformis]
MANPPKPWKAEYAKSSRSSCKTCKNPIDKEIFRLGKMVQATQFDGFMPMWHHASCILRKAKQIKSLEDVEGVDQLRWEDQQKIREYVEGGGSGSSNIPAPAAMECGIEVSQTSRASCRHCNQKIVKGEVRLSSKPEGQRAKSLAWHHAKCFSEISSTTQVEKLSGWDSLSAAYQTVVLSLFKSSSSTGNKTEPKEELAQESTSKAGAKRKKASKNSEKLKIAKAEADVSASKNVLDRNTNNVKDGLSKASELESQLEAQTKALWALKDDLKKHVSTGELREMLEANDQESTGSELDLRDRCADRMLFGALPKCPLCSGYLRYSGGMYKCHGYLSAWSKCSYSATDIKRVKGKWKIPDETSNEYLLKWNKSQKLKKPERILPPATPSKASVSQAANGLSQSSKGENLGDLKVALAGSSEESRENWKSKIEEAGGQLHAKIKKDTNCLVVIGMLDDQDSEIKKARRMKVPIVREDYLVDSIERKKKLPFDLYKLEAYGETGSMVTVKVKGRSAVHESSGLQDSGHILEDKTSIYNTTLNMSDLSSGINSYYILQIIEEDKGSECYVFRKWGRVGNEKIGGNKLEEMSKSDAIQEFKRLFLEKTGNSWEAWEQKTNFQKQPGRFYPLDIDYGVDKKPTTKRNLNDTNSKLAPPLIELMKMLFNVETYRAAMMEFEINMSEMPLGKLSKRNIQKGFEALTEIQNLLSGTNHDPAVKETLLVDASNRFFTVIPSIHPHVIKDEDDFKLKIKMLEALQDIEIASRLVGFDIDNDDSLDDKYKKLHCDISPIPHHSEDYRVIEKYLQSTHAPTHKDWVLEVEEVFSLEREGEFDKFAPHREKLKNRMLLWHGSRLTNFVGILSQGLRIAPPEAPATGYMFGKGIYFADMVSKSAQYCFTDRKNPVGFMLLSEVALGEVYELKKAKYIDKPPKGKHSTKGLGKTVPESSEFVKWRDEVVVPHGKPVPSNVKNSELLYNEYIVYDTAQVKLQFLVKVRFNYKR